MEHHPAPYPAFTPRLFGTTRARGRVTVIGAGMAGLSAAYQLVLAGHDVTVLEARARAGGRVHTVREPFEDGQFAEAGAIFLPGLHTLTIGYANHFGLTLEPVDYQALGSDYYLRGVHVPNPNDPLAKWPVTLTPSEQNGGAMGLWASYVFPAAKALGDPRAPDWPAGAVAQLADISFAEFLQRAGASSGAIDILRRAYLDLWGDGIETVAALPVLRDLALSDFLVPPHLSGLLLSDPATAKVAQDEEAITDASAPPTSTYTIAGGNDRLPRALATSAELRHRIRYDTPVTRIEFDADGVRLACVTARGERVVADHVVSAIPFPVLRTMQLAVTLSVAKRRAIDTLPNTSVTKLFAQARSRAWLTEYPAAVTLTDLPVMWVQHATMLQPGPRAILSCYTAGPNARAFDAQPEDRRLATAVAQFDQARPGFAADFTVGTSHSWGLDPWALGDYCWFKPGQFADIYPYVSSAEGRLHFAGDQSSVLPAWIQGAIESGHRAALEVHAALQAVAPV